MTEPQDSRVQAVSWTMDCQDALALAKFWSGLLGGKIDDGATSDWASITHPGGRVSFARVPEPKTGKNRVHPDVVTSDLEAEVARVSTLGADVVERFEGPSSWVVLRDPEGNEFCLVPA